MRYRFLLEARWDLFDVSDAYESQVPGLGADFGNQVEERVREITGQPRHWGRVQPPVRGHEVRVAPVRRFPYLVIYEVTTSEVVIIAVTHVRRRGRHWRRRI
jgi:hypothetical protein